MGIVTRLFGDRDSTCEVTRAASRYRCVIVRVECESACRAALAVAGRRFLVDEIPQLPLADCDRSECRCSYELQEDRRSARRRAADAGMNVAAAQDS